METKKTPQSNQIGFHIYKFCQMDFPGFYNEFCRGFWFWLKVRIGKFTMLVYAFECTIMNVIQCSGTQGSRAKCALKINSIKVNNRATLVTVKKEKEKREIKNWLNFHAEPKNTQIVHVRMLELNGFTIHIQHGNANQIETNVHC